MITRGQAQNYFMSKEKFHCLVAMIFFLISLRSKSVFKLVELQLYCTAIWHLWKFSTAVYK